MLALRKRITSMYSIQSLSLGSSKVVCFLSFIYEVIHNVLKTNEALVIASNSLWYRCFVRNRFHHMTLRTPLWKLQWRETLWKKTSTGTIDWLHCIKYLHQGVTQKCWTIQKMSKRSWRRKKKLCPCRVAVKWAVSGKHPGARLLTLQLPDSLRSHTRPWRLFCSVAPWAEPTTHRHKYDSSMHLHAARSFLVVWRRCG